MMVTGRGRTLIHFTLFLDALLQVHFGVSFLFVGPGKLTTAHITAKRFFAGMRTNVRRQVIGTRKRTHTYATLKRFLAGMDANVSRQLIGARKSSITIFDGTRIWTLVHRRFTWPIRVFTRFDRHQF